MENKYFFKVEYSDGTSLNRTFFGRTYEGILSIIFVDPSASAATCKGIELPNGSWVPGHNRTWTPGDYDIKE